MADLGPETYLLPKEVAEVLRRSLKATYRVMEHPSFPKLKLPGRVKDGDDKKANDKDAGQWLIPRLAFAQWLHGRTEGQRGRMPTPLPSPIKTATSDESQQIDASHLLNGARKRGPRAKRGLDNAVHPETP